VEVVMEEEDKGETSMWKKSDEVLESKKLKYEGEEEHKL